MLDTYKRYYEESVQLHHVIHIAALYMVGDEHISYIHFQNNFDIDLQYVTYLLHSPTQG